MKKIDKLFKVLAAADAKTYYVGGYVRDKILGKQNKDIDVEIHNLTEDDFIQILKSMNIKVDLVGESFGVYKVYIDGIDYDFSFPRTETKVGDKHTDFEIVVDPFIGEYEASLRRDFTINALMENTLTGEILDFHDGLKDLENKIIRHTSDKFSEDGLRVYRAAQFAARFGFKIAESTYKLFTPELVKDLAIERVDMELQKVFEKSDKPSKFFNNLPYDVLLVHFPHIADFRQLICPYLDSVVDYKDHDLYRPLYLMTLYALTNTSDVKFVTNEKDFISAFNKFDLDQFLKAYNSESQYETYKFFDKMGELGLLMLKSYKPSYKVGYDSEYNRYLNLTSELVTGKELIAMGKKPGPEFKQVIELMKTKLFKGRHANAAKQEALSEVYK